MLQSIDVLHAKGVDGSRALGFIPGLRLHQIKGAAMKKL